MIVVSEVVVQHWRRYGKDRTYVNSADGVRLGWRDNQSGELHIDSADGRALVEEALALTTPRDRVPWPTPPSEPAPAVERAESTPVTREDIDTDAGLPGASLDAEYLRRKEARENRIRGKHPKIGGLLLALSTEPSSTTAFSTGAAGERATAARLEKACGDGVLFLHNRRLSASSRRGDIDHIAIAPSGVWVIDSKKYKDKKVEVRSTGWKSSRQQKLFVGGRDCTNFVAGIERQIEAVQKAVSQADTNGVGVQGVICFVEGYLPLLKELQIASIAIRGPKGTAKLLTQAGGFDEATRTRLHVQLNSLLPPAHKQAP